MTAINRIAILGAAGQLGRDLCTRLPGEIVPCTRAEVELTNPQAVRGVFTRVRPNIVINCAAYNFVDKAEDEPEAAFAVNAFAVRRLAEVCRDLEVLLVHFSTDYVFGLDSSRRIPYSESAAPGPLSVYGMSKLTGEYAVRSLCPKHIVIRTCGLYGRWGGGGKGGNFVETMLRLAGQGKKVAVVDDQILTPSYTADVAAATVQLLRLPNSGLYHLTNAGSCSWYEFARTIFELSGVQADLSPISSAAYGSRARRPAYSVLTTERSLGTQLRHWREALIAYLEERQHA